MGTSLQSIKVGDAPAFAAAVGRLLDPGQHGGLHRAGARDHQEIGPARGDHGFP